MATAVRTERKKAKPADAETKKHNIGKVVQVIGPVLDVEFESEHLPELYNALRIREKSDSGVDIDVTVEVQQHIGRNQVRAVAMSSTDAVVRGMNVEDTGGPITIPVGEAALGRILNVLGNPVDNGPAIPADAERWPIHRAAPEFANLEPKTEIFETGIKVVDLIAPFVKGGKIGLFGGAGVGKTVVIMELIHYVGASDLRPGRRHHRPGAGDGLCSPRRDGRVVARDHRARHLSGSRSSRFVVANPGCPVHRGSAL